MRYVLKLVMKKEKDINFVKHVTRLYSFTGVFPIPKKYLLVMIILCNFIQTTYFVKEIITTCYYLELSFVKMGLLVLTCVLISFTLLCLKSACGDENLWNDFIWNVESFDRIMNVDCLCLCVLDSFFFR